ncbi:MAG: extracellular solute-binding protein [Planctomycetaceae bacterium]
MSVSIGMLAIASGCGGRVEDSVMLHSTVDQEISAPILSGFHRAENKLIKPDATFASAEPDRGKLLDSIQHSRESDVLWTDDILLMIDLQRLGALAPHRWKVPPGFPGDMRAADGTWCGFAATARVLIVNTENLPDPKAWPRSVDELSDSEWNQRCAIARPLMGPAAIHAAIIADYQGEAAGQWFTEVADNAVVLPSDSAVAAAVAAGRVDWGLTDSNYAVGYEDQSAPVAIVFPDQETDQFGTVRIPHAVAVLAHAPHPAAAARLADYLLDPGTEDRLAMSDAAQIPISPQSTYKSRVLPASPVRWATTDFAAARKAWEVWAPRLQEIFPPPSSH